VAAPVAARARRNLKVVSFTEARAVVLDVSMMKIMSLQNLFEVPQPPPPPPAAAAAVPVVRIVTIPKIPKDNDEEEWQALELEQVPYNPSHVAPARNKMKSLMSCSSVHHALKTQLFVKDVGP
jgi:hypothetical protein